MNVSSIISQVRTLGYVNSNQVSDQQIVDWLNFEYYMLCSEIKKLNENYFFGYGTIDTVPYQNKYDLTTATSSTSAFEKMLQVSIKYDNDTYSAWATGTVYKKSDRVTNSGKTYIAKADHTAGATFAGDSTYWQQIYENYKQCSEQGFLYQIDGLNEVMTEFPPTNYQINGIDNPTYFMATTGGTNSLYIFPYPTNIVVEGIKYYGLKTPIDLTTTSTESDILIERAYHRVLVLALLPYVYQSRGLLNEKNDAIATYDRFKQTMLSEITDRNNSPTLIEMANLYHLE